MTRLARFAVFAAIVVLTLIIHTTEAHETTARDRLRALLLAPAPAPTQYYDPTAAEMRRLRDEMEHQAFQRQWEHMLEMNELRQQRQGWNHE